MSGMPSRTRLRIVVGNADGTVKCDLGYQTPPFHYGPIRAALWGLGLQARYRYHRARGRI